MSAKASPAACKCAAFIVIATLIGVVTTTAVQRMHLAAVKKPAHGQELNSAGAADASPVKGTALSDIGHTH